MKHLVLGGARSGKSKFAEKQALERMQNGDEVFYLATATAEDSEMQARIRHHQLHREPSIQLIEETLAIGDVVRKHNNENACIIIDCLTMWISNALHNGSWLAVKNEFIKAVKESHSNLIIVSNEVGHGVIPIGKLTRDFVDESGRLHQELAEICDQVTLIVAGLPLNLKGICDHNVVR